MPGRRARLRRWLTGLAALPLLLCAAFQMASPAPAAAMVASAAAASSAGGTPTSTAASTAATTAVAATPAALAATPPNATATALPPKTRQVLILYSLGTDSSSVWQSLLHKGFQDELQLHGGARPAIFEERMDAVRVGMATAGDAMAPYLLAKYAKTTFDAVITENFTAGRFLSAHPELFPGVPRYYVNHGRRKWQPSDGIGLEAVADFQRALAVIPRVMPEVRRIVVVGDRSARVREWMDDVRLQIPAYRGRIAFDIWDNFTFAELYQRAAALDARSAIFMLPTYRDRSGAEGVPPVIGRALAANSKAPVFTNIESLIVGGVAGGYVLSGEQMGRVIARVMLQLPVDMGSVQGYVFDYQAVRQHHMSRLPEGALLLNRPQGVWDLYRWQIIVSLTLILLQAVLISALVVALRGRRQSMAALNDERDNLERRVTSRTLELQAANTQLERLATTDPLTGIGNRRKMTEQIGQELERARRLQHPLALLMIDIDHFKRINDSHGHEIGDRAIIAVAGTLSAAMRTIDMVSRFGGEEFVLLMPETNLPAAAIAAERLRGAVADLALQADDGQRIALTISIGVAAAEAQGGPGHQGGDTPSTLLVRADKALYRAKQAGRDRVISG